MSQSVTARARVDGSIFHGAFETAGVFERGCACSGFWDVSTNNMASAAMNLAWKKEFARGARATDDSPSLASL